MWEVHGIVSLIIWIQNCKIYCDLVRLNEEWNTWLPIENNVKKILSLTPSNKDYVISIQTPNQWTHGQEIRMGVSSPWVLEGNKMMVNYSIPPSLYEISTAWWLLIVMYILCLERINDIISKIAKFICFNLMLHEWNLDAK